MEQRMAVAAVAEAAAGVERAQALLEATVVLAREAGAAVDGTGFARVRGQARSHSVHVSSILLSECALAEHGLST